MKAKINLLPEAKQAKLKQKQRKQLVVSASVASVVIAASIIVMGFLIILGQNLRIRQLSSSITSKKNQVATYPDIKTVLSVQARVDALPKLFSQRVYMTTLVNALTQEEPQDVAFSSLTVSSNALTITATGKSYLAAARVAKALEADTKNLSNVSLSSVSLSNNVSSFSISATINPGATNGK